MRWGLASHKFAGLFMHDKHYDITKEDNEINNHWPIILSEVLYFSGFFFTLSRTFCKKSWLWIGSDHIGPPKWNLRPHSGHVSPTGGPVPGGYFFDLPSSIRLPTKEKSNREYKGSANFLSMLQLNVELHVRFLIRRGKTRLPKRQWYDLLLDFVFVGKQLKAAPLLIYRISFPSSHYN